MQKVSVVRRSLNRMEAGLPGRQVFWMAEGDEMKVLKRSNLFPDLSTTQSAHWFASYGFGCISNVEAEKHK